MLTNRRLSGEAGIAEMLKRKPAFLVLLNAAVLLLLTITSMAYALPAFKVVQHGAAGNGNTLDSPANQRTIDAASVHGGTVSQLMLHRSGFWTVHICCSHDVAIDKITIRNNEDGRGPSTDGIDIDSSRNILMSYADTWGTRPIPSALAMIASSSLCAEYE